MGTMKTADDPKNYQPVTLIAPDGREFTPSSLREHNELVSTGYRTAPTTSEEPAPDQGQAQPTGETSTGEVQTVAPATAETAAEPTTASAAPAGTAGLSSAPRGKGATK